MWASNSSRPSHIKKDRSRHFFRSNLWVHKLSEASAFMCENRWGPRKKSAEREQFHQHGASHNVHLHFCIILFSMTSTFSPAASACWWNKNPTETFLCSCQDCFFLCPRSPVKAKNERLMTSCPDIIFILWALPFACCTPHGDWREMLLLLALAAVGELIVAMSLMGKW